MVALVGVQTNQFPRAQDLARESRAAGADVLIGGFHVSGSLGDAAHPPPECQAMIDAGVTLVAGEVEGRWASILRDVAAGKLQPIYNFLQAPPDLADAPMPRPWPPLQRKFAVRGSATVDASRGCPFQCSFCTIIHVQGRAMRTRDPGAILATIRANAMVRPKRRRVRYYFFTDDNFARNRTWEAVFDGLIALRAEGIGIDFMMQVDIAATRIPRFVEKAAAAGCVQVFIGMESIREDNLAAAGKRQNRVGHYRDSIDRWHDAGIVCHVGYIIGFPADTYARVMADVRALRADLGVDQASFFMLTPLPGSDDHRAAVDAGVVLDADYNRFDSFHPVAPHPRMSPEEWTAAFHDAWREFYSTEHIERALLRQNPHTYWALFKVFIWYRAAMHAGAHPMVTGFVRRRSRRERRPSFPREHRLRFIQRVVGGWCQEARAYGAIALEMRDLRTRTRIRRRDYRRWPALAGILARRTTSLDVKRAWRSAHVASPLAPAARGRTRVHAIVRRRIEASRDRAEEPFQPIGGPTGAVRRLFQELWRVPRTVGFFGALIRERY